MGLHSPQTVVEGRRLESIDGRHSLDLVIFDTDKRTTVDTCSQLVPC